MLEAVKQHIHQQFPEVPHQTTLIACSGGLDSVVLAHLFLQLNFPFQLAHCNFKLRAEESDGDEQFVIELAKEFAVEIHVQHFQTQEIAKQQSASIQMVARELRYTWFQELANKHQLHAIATAHHLDDSLETFIINFSRGTGLEGLIGIPASNKNVIRPLLPFSRAQLLQYAQAEGLQWREDSSNASKKYLRNNIRHEVIPLLKKLHPTFLENFKTTKQHLLGSQQLLEAYKMQLQTTLFKKENNTIKIKISALEELLPIAEHLYLLFKEFGFTEWKAIKNLLTSSSGKEVRSATHRLLRDRTHFIVSPLAATKSTSIFTIASTEINMVHPIQLRFEEVSSIENIDKHILYADYNKLKFPLTLRRWEKGDYFFPLGMKGKKKVAKYFKDVKMDIINKEKQWLLFSGDDLVWIVNQRADDRFKVTSNTVSILKISLQE